MKNSYEANEISFNDALTIIANTKKSAIKKEHKGVAIANKGEYNSEHVEATKPPQPTKRSA